MNARLRAFTLSLLLPSLAGPVLLAPARALAQEDPAVTAEARKRFQEGVRLFDEKKFELARAAFLQAYALKKHPDVLLNLAQAEMLSGKAFEAAGHFKEFLRDPATASHPKRAEAEKGLADARGRIGRIQIAVDVPDAELYLDGKKIGTSPLGEPLDVTPGPHVVEAKKGDKAGSQGVMAAEGKITMAQLNLGGGGAVVAPVPVPAPKDEPKPAPPKDEPRPAPPSEPAADARFSTSGGDREKFMTWAKRSPVAWASGGAAVVGLGMFVLFTKAKGDATSNADDIKDQIKARQQQPDPPLGGQGPCAPTQTNQVKAVYGDACKKYQSSIDDSNTDAKFANVGLGLAVIGAAGLVGGYFLTARKGDAAAAARAPRREWAVAPMVGPELRGIAAAGSF
ncbi:MAG: hypothetical protein IT374_20580 [Polyangiaceae bacterium]|nr:hypothetical protein [Polyangiaceae bacterium]